MKKNISYFNNEERNGIFLLVCLILLFSIFIFFQKRVLPSQTTFEISLNEIQAKEELNPTVDPEDIKIVQKEKVNSKKLAPKPINSFPEKKNPPAAHIKPPKKISNPAPKKRKIFKAKPYKKLSFKKSKKKPVKAFDLNSQNVEDWKQINGIGDGYANRIIKYQNWLGGFHSAEQLAEVYGLEDSIIVKITPHLVNAQNFVRIDINHVEAKELGSHPYIDWKEADILVKFRKHNFPITEDSFSSLIGLSTETKTKLLPYLDFEVEEEMLTMGVSEK